MNPSALLLLALKGTCALNCLAALHLAGPLPVTQRAIMDLTGFDDDAVRKGLNTLRVLGLATCTGHQHRTAWQLAPSAHRLPLPLAPLLSIPEKPESDGIKEEEELSTDETNNSLNSSSVLEAPNPEKLESGAAGNDDQTQPPAPGSRAHKSLNAARLRAEAVGPARRRVKGELRAQFYAAFEAASIYLQFRRPLADALLAAEDGPAWLWQTLGWLCYAERRLPHVQRGAVVYISLRDRLPCDPAYLPPHALPFEAALAWALRGGEDEPEPTESDDAAADAAADDVSAIDGQLPPSFKGRGAGGVRSPSAEDDLWQALIARLSRELSPAVIDSQLRPARLLSLGAERALIGVPTAQSRDWLRTRLAAVLARALAELTGRALSVEIVVDN